MYVIIVIIAAYGLFLKIEGTLLFYCGTLTVVSLLNLAECARRVERGVEPEYKSDD